MKAQRLLMHVLALALLLPAIGAAQAPAAPAPEIRYVSVTRFAFPDDTLERGMVEMWLDSVMVPQARMNQNITSMKIATHNWGSNSRDAVLIAEYPSWVAIDADCKACDDWFTARQPKSGTPQRAKWDAAGEAFRKAYLGHRDELYTYRVNRSK